MRQNRVITRVLHLLRSRPAMIGSLLTLTFKATGTLLMAGTFILAARAISPDAFGHLAVAFNVLSFIAVVATLGQDTLFVRCWGEYFGRDDELAHGAYLATWRVVVLGIVVSGTGVVLLGIFGPFGYSAGEVAAACAFLTAQIVLTFNSTSCRHILNYVVSESHRELTWRIALVVVVAASLKTGLTPSMFLLAAAGGMALAVAGQAVALVRGFPREVLRAHPRMEHRAWARRARSMWVSASIEAATQYAEVILLGFLVSPATAGAYFVAARIANLFAMLGSGLHTYTVSYAASLFFASEHRRLQGILRSVMAVALAMATPALFVIVVAGSSILGLFGPHYAHHLATLVVLATGSYVMAMAGPASGILQTTGHERLYSRVILAALVVRTLLLIVLAPRLGALGAALAWSGVNAPVAVGLSIACRRLAGVDPSVLSVFTGRRTITPEAISQPAGS